MAGLHKPVQKTVRIGLLLLLGAAIGWGGQRLTQLHFRLHQQENFASQDRRPAEKLGGLSKQEYQRLAKLTYRSGQLPVVQVNAGKSTLNPKAWRTSHVEFQQLDQLGRTSGSNTDFLNWQNHANTALRNQQTVAPAGWHDNRNQLLIYNRGHMIAYSLTRGIDKQTGRFSRHGADGDENNPRNLFTETDFTNQMLQTIYEGQVRRAIEAHQRVIYQATPVFRGNELMPRGINLQAISTTGQLNFNVYLFNVEPGMVFDYQTGNALADPSMKIPVPLDPHGDTADNHDEQRDDIKMVGTYSRPVATHPRQYIRVFNQR